MGNSEGSWGKEANFNFTLTKGNGVCLQPVLSVINEVEAVENGDLDYELGLIDPQSGGNEDRTPTCAEIRVVSDVVRSEIGLSSK